MARILIVDSDPKTRLHIHNLLSASGHQLLEAQTGIEGIRLATVHQPDLILLEVNLSDLDGYEVTLRLRGMPLLKPVPILILSPQPDRQTTLAVGANSTIETPIDAARFQRKIEHYLRGFRDMAEGTGEHRLREQSWRIVERLEKKVVELSDANKRMQDMMRLRREFLQNVTHELATPMTPVMGYLRLLLSGDMGALSPMQEKSLHAIEASVHRLRSIIDALLDVSSLETERMHFYDRDYDLKEILHAALEGLRVRIEDKGIKLALKVPDAPFPAKGDPHKVQRAMTHLVDNAIKFTPRGSQIAIEVLVQGQGPKKRYELWVSDSGPGIPAPELQRVFDPFYQVDGSATRKYGGMGLGLAFAKRVAQSSGGEIRIISPPDRTVAGQLLSGTLAVFWIPLQRSELMQVINQP